jgi:galactokinase/mevalonate kinase-like predicted kinase
MTTTAPGLIPDPRIQFIPPDVLDPGLNGGLTLLYYTGLRRLAKNILHDVVGRYLDRDRAGLATLRAIHAFPPRMAEAMASKDVVRFGELVEAAWGLKKDIDPDSTNDVIEGILAGARPGLAGATLLGAGGGGFLLFVARSADDAAAIRARLEAAPPNERARFFDFGVSGEGLVVTAC